ncbi:MAG TPA: transcription termination factor NusA [Actinomycetota bacterium]|nr:transcription termination factor NusA [Actinomycetota bacterium]
MDPIDMDALKLVEREKGISYESVVQALEQALAAAYKRSPGAAGNEARVEIDRRTGHVRVFAQEGDFNEETGEFTMTKEWEDTPPDFGRIAAQTAKQVILQRIRDAEREITYGEYSGREGDIVTAIVQQADPRYVLLDLGRGVEALLPQQEQVAGERYDHGSRLKAYIVEVRRSPRGPQIICSRTHPNLIRKLFELEVPEIMDGIVEIKGVAREAGHRSKIAVASNDPNVDPTGACVGPKGSRVRMVVTELRGEKVDIIEWSEEAEKFVANALSPAKVKEVVTDSDSQTAEVTVPDFQLSLAIGKEGQNARLAARLTGWRVDIKSEMQITQEKARKAKETAPPKSTAQASEPAAPSEPAAETPEPADPAAEGTPTNGEARAEANAEIKLPVVEAADSTDQAERT